jgi:hypothetical protein
LAGHSIDAKGTDLSFAWDPSTDPSVIGYKVYYGTASQNYTNFVSTGMSTSATISNLTTGVTYYFAATTCGPAGLESSFSTEASYTVPAPVNVPPTLDPIGNVVINENAGPQTVSLSGISSGSSSENQVLTVSAFSSNPGLIPNPTINYTSPNPTGSIAFTPVTGAFGGVTMTVMVDDGGAVSNTVIRTFTVTVNAINNPPTLDPINDVSFNENSGPQTVSLTGITAGLNEVQPITVTATSSNPSLVPNPAIAYTSPNTTGTLTLTPQTNAYGTASITVVVSDGQALNGTTNRSFNVTVNQVVQAPNAMTNSIISPYQTFRLVLNSPVTNGDRFSYSLDSTAPLGARIATRRGVGQLVWTPTSAQASTTNLILIHATDNNNSALNTNEAVQVIVLDYMKVAPGMTAIQAGQNASLPIAVSSSDGLTNFSFTLNWPASRFSNPTLNVTSPTSFTGTVQIQGTNLLVNIKATPGQVMIGSNLVAQLNFQSSSSQSSAFVDLPVQNTAGTKPTGSVYVNAASQWGQVVVVKDLPLLQSTVSGSSRTLQLYGKVGTTYQLQSSTNLLQPSAWTTVLSYTQTNVAQSLSADQSTPVIFYRLKQ